MKRLITIIMLLLIVIACKKENSNNKENVSTNNNWGTFLTATINGEEFSSSVKVITFTANNQIDLSRFNHGMYFMKIQEGSRIMSTKIVKL